MKNVAPILLFFFLLAMATGPAEARKVSQREDWHHSLGLGRKEKVSHLHFFFHNIMEGKNVNALWLVQPKNSLEPQTLFGNLAIGDDVLTEGPELTSKVVGRAQGIFASIDRENPAFIMDMEYSFTEGKYNGSSFSIVGKNRSFKHVREMAIVGGTGMFRLARGVAIATTYFNTLAMSIVEYNVTIIHY